MNWFNALPAAVKTFGAAVLTLLIVGGLMAAVSYCTKKDERHEEQLVNSGVAQERLDANEKVISDVQKANDAVDRPEPAAVNSMQSKYDRCKRTADCQ